MLAAVSSEVRPEGMGETKQPAMADVKQVIAEIYRDLA